MASVSQTLHTSSFCVRGFLVPSVTAWLVEINAINPDLELWEQSINNLFQGSDRKVAVNYPGDIQMSSEDCMTIQIHRVTSLLSQVPHQTSLAVAVLMPKNLPGFIVER